MLVTSLKFYHLPEEKIEGPNRIIKAYHLTFHQVREYVAYLNGEGSMNTTVYYAQRELGMVSDIRERSKDLITIETKDGKIEYSKSSLMRRYHFFDDFFSTFPDNGSINVPFTTREVDGAVYLDGSNTALSECLQCMKYFNPKSNDEYFQIESLGEISDDDLLDLVRNLNEDDVADIIEARDAWMYEDLVNYPLPRGGRDRPALVCILEAFGEDDRLIRFFPAYPSYLVCAISEGKCVDILLKTDFSKSKEYCPSASAEVLNRIIMSIGTCDDKEDTKRLLSMIGVSDTCFGNNSMEVTAPYHCSYSSRITGREIRTMPYVMRNLRRLFDPDEIELDITSSR